MMTPIRWHQADSTRAHNSRARFRGDKRYWSWSDMASSWEISVCHLRQCVCDPCRRKQCSPPVVKQGSARHSKITLHGHSSTQRLVCLHQDCLLAAGAFVRRTCPITIKLLNSLDQVPGDLPAPRSFPPPAHSQCRTLQHPKNTTPQTNSRSTSPRTRNQRHKSNACPFRCEQKPHR